MREGIRPTHEEHKEQMGLLTARDMQWLGGMTCTKGAGVEA